jgi:hypothetical protein
MRIGTVHRAVFVQEIISGILISIIGIMAMSFTNIEIYGEVTICLFTLGYGIPA